MQLAYTASQNLEDLATQLNVFDQDTNVKSLLVFIADANGWNKADLDPILSQVETPLMGGIFPEVVYQQQNYQSGAVVVGLSYGLQPQVIEGLSDNQQNYELLVEEAIDEDLEFRSLVVFVDGLASRISGFLDGLYAVLGPDVDYIGGGAGSLSFEKQPCVLTNSGVYQDAAVLGLLLQDTIIEVGHGWHAFNEGHMVTRVEKNVVHEIDYQNALDVYQSMIGEQLDEPLNEENFFKSAQSFPLGIKKYQGLHIVRDPIAINGEALICVGELTQGDHIDILTAKPNDLIAAAGKTASLAEQKYQQAQSSYANTPGVLLIDCISRGLFLGEEFTSELQAVQQSFANETPLFGALVLGEIANSGTSYLEFYNKTAVVAIV